MAAEIENKYVVLHQLGDHTSFDPTVIGGANVASGWINQGITSNADFYKIIPSVVAGTNSITRIGATIRPKSLKVQLQFALNQTAGSQNIQVRLMGFTHKEVKSYDAFDKVSSATSTYFSDQLVWNGVTGTYCKWEGGEPYWLNMPINNRVINKFHDSQFTLSKGTGLARQSNAGAGAQVCVNAYQQIHEVTINVPIPASYKYDGQSAFGFPTNHAPFLAVGYTQMDGLMSQDPQYNTKLVVMNMKCSLSYEDA